MTFPEDKLRELDNSILDDTQELREEFQGLPEELSNFIGLLKELESVYSDLINSNQGEGEKNVEEAMNKIKSILRELEDMSGTLDDLSDTTVSLEENFSKELDLLIESREN